MEDPSAGPGDRHVGDADDLVHRFQDLVGMDLKDAIEFVYRTARRLTKGDVQAAQDLAQDSWQRIYEFLKGRPSTPVQAAQPWLRQVVLNVMLEGIRRDTAAKRGGQHTTESLDQRIEAGGSPPTDEAAGPESQVVRNDLSVRLHMAVAELPEHLRSVATLTLQGHTHQEISEILAIPVNTSKTRLRKAVELLRGVGSLVAK